MTREEELLILIDNIRESIRFAYNHYKDNSVSLFVLDYPNFEAKQIELNKYIDELNLLDELNSLNDVDSANSL